LIAVLVLATGSATAKATKMRFSYSLFTCRMDEPLWDWYSGGDPPTEYHARGQISFGHFVSSEVDWWHGTNPGIGNLDVKWPSFTGNARGVFAKMFNDEKVGKLGGRWVGKLTEGAFELWAVAWGSGDLEGIKYTAHCVPAIEPPPHDDPCVDYGAPAINVYDCTAVLVSR
jgi:hypothetical protein